MGVIAGFISARTTWRLSTPLALLVVLPVAALERGSIRRDRSDLNLVAQEGATIPAEIQALAAKARELHGRQEPQQALAQMEQVMAWAKANLATADPFRANIQAWMGLLLSANGRHQEALAPAQEAVQIYELLANTNPFLRQKLALASDNLASIEHKLGNPQGQNHAEETVKRYEELVKMNPTNPTDLGDLAHARINLGAHFSRQGRDQEALSLTETRVQSYRELAHTNPGYLNEQAMATNNLGFI
jgi:tetratricopeptide (TPR) repeat protein